MRILNISAALALALASSASAAIAAVPANQDTAVVVERPNVEHAGVTHSAAGVGSRIASYAHSIACSKAGLLNALCNHPRTAAPDPRRDEIVGHAMEMTTSWTTIESTSTIGSTTTTVYLTPSSSASTADGIDLPKILLETERTSSTVTNPTSGISIVATTVVKTIIYHASSSSTSTTTPNTTLPASTATETCTNNTSIDTQAYINISTFSIPGLTYAPESTSASLCNSSAATANATSLVTASTTSGAASTDDTLGYTGAVTSTLGSAAGKSFDFGGFRVPAGMVAAMAGCFVLALLL